MSRPPRYRSVSSCRAAEPASPLPSVPDERAPSGARRPRTFPNLPERAKRREGSSYPFVDLFNHLNQMMGRLQKLGLVNIEPEPQ